MLHIYEDICPVHLESLGMTWARISSSLENSICLNSLVLPSFSASVVFLSLRLFVGEKIINYSEKIFVCRCLRLGESFMLCTTPRLSPRISRGSPGLKERLLRLPWALLRIFWGIRNIKKQISREGSMRKPGYRWGYIC